MISNIYPGRVHNKSLSRLCYLLYVIDLFLHNIPWYRSNDNLLVVVPIIISWSTLLSFSSSPPPLSFPISFILLLLHLLRPSPPHTPSSSLSSFFISFPISPSYSFSFIPYSSPSSSFIFFFLLHNLLLLIVLFKITFGHSGGWVWRNSWSCDLRRYPWGETWEVSQPEREMERVRKEEKDRSIDR